MLQKIVTLTSHVSAYIMLHTVCRLVLSYSMDAGYCTVVHVLRYLCNTLHSITKIRFAQFANLCYHTPWMMAILLLWG